jgi:hypothetical protein
MARAESLPSDHPLDWPPICRSSYTNCTSKPSAKVVSTCSTTGEWLNHLASGVTIELQHVKSLACEGVVSVNDADREENSLADSTEGKEGMGSGATATGSTTGGRRNHRGAGFRLVDGWFRQAQPPAAHGAVAPRS